MALRLKKDVQKASYYVWFLGAQEAKELRGERVLTSTIPRLIERSRHQEPLKVTLQVSHKGLKIIQVCYEPTATSNAAQFQSLSVFTLAFCMLKHTAERYDFNTEQFSVLITETQKAFLLSSDNIVLLFTKKNLCTF